MKTFLKNLIAVITSSAMVFGAQALSPGDIRMSQRNAQNTNYADVVFSTANNSLIGTSSTGVTSLVTLGTGITLASGVLTVTANGTGNITGTIAGSNAVLLGNGTNSVKAIASLGTSGQPLISAGSGAPPVFGTLGITGGGTGVPTMTANAVVIGNGTSAVTFVSPGTTGNVLTSDGTNWVSGVVSGTGTVTSVAISAPSLFSVAGSPVTSSGTLALSYSGTALPVANGGTGATSLTSAGIILGNGTGAVTTLVGGTSGNVVTWNGTAWTSQTPGAGSGNVTVSGTPTSGQIAEWTSATNVQGKAVVGSGNVVLDTAPVFSGNLTLATSATPSTTAVGALAFDTNAWGLDRGAAQLFDGTANTNIVAALASDTPTNGQVPTWNTGGTITWETPGAGAGNVTNSGTLTSGNIVMGAGTTVVQATGATYGAANGGTITLGNIVLTGNGVFTTNTINVTDLNVTNPIGVAAGGTGVSTITSAGIMIGNGTGAITTLLGVTSGNVVTWNGTAWTSAAPTGGGNVSSTSTFGTDNVLIRSDGISRNVQSSNITISDADVVAGVAGLTTSTLTVGTKNLTIAGNLTTVGTGNLTLTTSGATSASFPGTGTVTLVDEATAQVLANKTLSSPAIGGVFTTDGANIISPNAMGALAIDVTRGINTKSIAANETFTFSATPATNTWFSAIIKADATARTATIPSSKQAGSLATVTSVVVPASGQVHLTWHYDGTNYIVYGAEVPAPPLTVYGAGTAYALTNTAAAIDFGTTDPTKVINAAGTYLVFGQVNLAYTGATVAAETATIKVRRTNNTAADVSEVVVLDLPVSTTLTHTYGLFTIPPFTYTTANADDSLSLFANVSAALSAGTIDATAVGTSLVAIKLY